MTNLLRTALWAAVGCAVFCACPRTSADVSDLPIGHMKITVGPDGTLNVEARCVPAREVLEKLAAVDGQTVEFEKACLTYVDVWKPDRFEKPEYWMNVAACAASACRMQCHRENATWHTHILNGDGYDPSLDEAQIRSHSPVFSPVATTPHDGIDAGVLILNGAVVAPPYSLEVHEGRDGSAQLTVNGLVVLSCPPPNTQRPASPLPESGQFAKTQDITSYVSDTLYPSLIREMRDVGKALDGVESFLREQAIVGRVLRKGRDKPWPDTASSSPLMAISRGGTAAWPVFVEMLDLESGEYWPSQYSPKMAAESQLNETARQLSSGYVVFLARNGFSLSVLRPSLLCGAVQVAESLPLLQAECILDEVIGDRDVARETAVQLLACPGVTTRFLCRDEHP